MIRPVTKYPIELISSERGSLHCAQATIIMLIYAMTGLRMSWQGAEEATGYKQGFYTWPYAALISMAERGIASRLIETVDAEAMARDPEAEIRRLYPDTAIAEDVLKKTDLPAEQKRAKACLMRPEISFERRAPVIEDIKQALLDNIIPVVSVNYSVLHTQKGYEGHAVIVSGMEEDELEIYDPGPPAQGPWLIAYDVFERAMYSPSPDDGALKLFTKM